MSRYPLVLSGSSWAAPAVPWASSSVPSSLLSPFPAASWHFLDTWWRVVTGYLGLLPVHTDLAHVLKSPRDGFPQGRLLLNGCLLRLWALKNIFSSLSPYMFLCAPLQPGPWTPMRWFARIHMSTSASLGLTCALTPGSSQRRFLLHRPPLRPSLCLQEPVPQSQWASYTLWKPQGPKLSRAPRVSRASRPGSHPAIPIAVANVHRD